MLDLEIASLLRTIPNLIIKAFLTVQKERSGGKIKKVVWYFQSCWVWNLIASTSQGDNGCAAQRISDSNAGTVELCKSRCFEAGASFLQFHSTGFCGCFDACPLNRDASRYNSPADVYQLESQISSSMPTKAPTMLSNGNIFFISCFNNSNGPCFVIK